ncbi:curli production assembly/transport component CsgF [Xanthovirga aplysinae]|uniref:curli production assembly/transport component CsgF n=1 Tax=Xanthovirga aplysinae TaxID=2529853 RepID=UPI0012BC38FE|nr:curli production assembly/transport component CsgF [Xanthovirga aplysinae]MTI29874.1 curli production assembly/transport component CsgF [Xanthovirga aplysinae]
MMNKSVIVFLIGLLSGICSLKVQAQDFVYKPINPAFGGEVFNYQWLQSSATAQNSHEEEKEAGEEEGLFDDFSESLKRQLLNTLSRELTSSQFGEDGLEVGSYNLGGLDVDIAESLEGTVITIFDRASGSETTVVVPYY